MFLVLELRCRSVGPDFFHPKARSESAGPLRLETKDAIALVILAGRGTGSWARRRDDGFLGLEVPFQSTGIALTLIPPNWFMKGMFSPPATLLPIAQHVIIVLGTSP